MKKKIIMKKCKTHPTYKGIHKPRATKKFPKGCVKCWELWYSKLPFESIGD